MKLTKKILVAFFFVVIIGIIGFIYFTLDGITVKPQPLVKSYIMREYDIKNFNNIKVTGNQWVINIVKADTFGIKIEGPDNLVNNYLLIDKSGDSLLLGIKPEMNENYYNVNLDISIPELKNLTIDNSKSLMKITNKLKGKKFVFYKGKIKVKVINFDTDSLNIEIRGITYAKINNCRINNLGLKANFKSGFYIHKCEINNLHYNLSGVSFLETKGFVGDYTGRLNNYSVVRMIDKNRNKSYLYSDSLISIFASLGQAFPNLKWGSKELSVSSYFVNQGAVIDTSLTFSKSSLSEIIFGNWDFYGLKTKLVSAYFLEGKLIRFEIIFTNSVATEQINSLLIEHFGLPNNKGTLKIWKRYSSEGNVITLVNTNNGKLAENIVSIQPAEWYDIYSHIKIY